MQGQEQLGREYRVKGRSCIRVDRIVRFPGDRLLALERRLEPIALEHYSWLLAGPVADQVIHRGSEEANSATIMHCLVEARTIEVFNGIRVPSSVFRADWQSCQPNVWHGHRIKAVILRRADEPSRGLYKNSVIEVTQVTGVTR